jgi:nicotinamidase-related amidase
VDVLNYKENRISTYNATLVLIDYQVGTIQAANGVSADEFKSNVLALAKLGKIHELPTIITSTGYTGTNGPIIPELLELYPDTPIIHRFGQICAWDNPEFLQEVKATKRKNLIMAGVKADVSLAYAAMQAAAHGFNVYAVMDASGAESVLEQQITIARLSSNGVVPVTWLMVAAELQHDWRLPTSQATADLLSSHLTMFNGYSMVME